MGLVSRTDAARSLVGTEGYIPPEGPGSPRADIYSLGKVLYEAATGKDRLKFPEPLSDIEANLKFAELNPLILKACDSDPRRRYASVEALRDDLLLLKSGESLRRLWRLERRTRRMVKVMAMASALVCLTATGWWLQRRQTTELNRVAEESRRRLVRVLLLTGLQIMERGDLLATLPWFVESLRSAERPDEAWPHLRRIEAVLRQCPSLEGLGLHENAVNSAEFSRDGLLILTASEDGSARVWDAASSRPITPRFAHRRAVNEARFSPDGRRVVTASSDGTAQVWDVASGAPSSRPLVHSKEVWTASFSPDGDRVLTACEDGSARLWDVGTGSVVGSPMSHAKAINHAAFSPDGRLVVTSSDDKTARLWNGWDGSVALPPLAPCRPGAMGRLQPRWTPSRLRWGRRHGAHLEHRNGGGVFRADPSREARILRDLQP